MKKLSIFLLLFFTSVFLFGQENRIEKVKRKINHHNAVRYHTTAYYPNPETEEIKTFNAFYIVNNYGSENFDFYCKSDNSEEICYNGVYAELNHANKTIYQYEEKKNQTDRILNSVLVQYGPTFLINHDWKYQDEVLLNGINHSHYSFMQKTYKYEEKIAHPLFKVKSVFLRKNKCLYFLSNN